MNTKSELEFLDFSSLNNLNFWISISSPSAVFLASIPSKFYSVIVCFIIYSLLLLSCNVMRFSSYVLNYLIFKLH